MHYYHKLDKKKFPKYWFEETYSPLMLIKKSNLSYTIKNFKPPTSSLKIIPLPRLEFCKERILYINLNVLFGDCIFENNNIYVGSTSTTLSRRYTMHLFNASSIALHLTKKHSCPTTELRKILTENTILEQQNNKQKLQILEALQIKNINPDLIEFILKPVLMYLYVFRYWRYLYKQIRKVNATQYDSTNAHSYKVVMYIQTFTSVL